MKCQLFYGSVSGSVKVWDFGSGQEIKWKPGRPSDEELSITGLLFSELEGDRVIIVSGWNNRIRILLVRIRRGAKYSV